MRKIPRLSRCAAAGLMAAVAVSVAACGSSVPEIPAPSSTPEAAPSPTADGVTTPAQVFGPACAQLPQNGVPGSAIMMSRQPVAAALATNPLLKTLGTAVLKGGVADTLNSAKDATVFAPYDDAFTDLRQSMGPDNFNALLANKDALADILKYHVVVRRYDRAGLASAGTVTTLQGGNLKVKDAGDTMNITDNAGKTAHVLCGNIPTKNATVFLIDKVMQPKPN